METLRKFWELSVEICVHPSRFFATLAKQEQVLAGDVFRQFAVYGAAIPAAAGFVGSALVGTAGVLEPVVPTLLRSLVLYVGELAYLWLLAAILDYVSVSYDCTPGFNRLYAGVVYASAPAFWAGAFQVIPLLGSLTVLGLYSLYLLYAYLPSVSEVPEGKRRSFGLAAVLFACGLWVFVSLALSLIVG